MRANVVVNVYNGTGSIFSVDIGAFGKDRVTFGNKQSDDIFVDSSALSQQHGYFQYTNVGWVIVDNHSKNGILINGAKRSDAQLVDGMEIRIVDEMNKSIPAVTMFVDVKGESTEASSKSVNFDTPPEEPKPKKKSKAPLIIVIILVVLLALGGIAVVVLGLLGFGVYNYFKPVETNPNHNDSYVEEVTVEDSASDEYFENVTENEPSAETDAPVELPPRVPTSAACEQFVLAECDGTYATLTFYEKEDGVWVEKLTADGRIGKNGITQNKREGDGCTPAGEFDLTFCCGLSDPGTDMDFQIINSYSVWVDDADSDYYNTLQYSDSYYKDWDSAEPMYDSYFKSNRHNYCINIDANGDGISSDGVVSGGGSVITLCGKNDTLKATQGCVDISGEDMLDFLSYLDSAKNPVIIIY